MQGVFLLINFGDRAHASGAMLEAFETVIRERGVPYRLERSRSIPHCHRLIGQAREAGFETLIVGGGDGTLNVVLNHPLAPRFTLGVLPLGTVNALARTLGMDARRPVDALRATLTGQPTPSTVGLVEDRRFICFASAGFDAEVVHRARGPIKRLLRRGAFGAVGLWEAALIHRLPRFAFKVDSASPGRANVAVVSNIPCYAGATLFDTTVQVTSFQGFALDAPSAFRLLRLAWSALHGPPMDWVRRVPGASPFPSFQRLQVRCARPVAVQIDGEPIGLKNPRRFDFRVAPEPQSFLIPRLH